MILNSEDQRKSLLALIEIAPVQGPVSEVRKFIAYTDNLKREILEAKIQEKPKEEGKEKP
jgi:hypothetical protein